MKLETTGGRKWPEKKKEPPQGASKAQAGLFIENPDAVISYGKYKSKTLGEVKRADDSYYKWLKKEGLIQKWGLTIIREDAMRPIIIESKHNLMVWHDGSVMVGIKEVNEPCKPASVEWYHI